MLLNGKFIYLSSSTKYIILNSVGLQDWNKQRSQTDFNILKCNKLIRL